MQGVDEVEHSDRRKTRPPKLAEMQNVSIESSAAGEFVRVARATPLLC
jgi:hypothetical protein